MYSVSAALHCGSSLENFLLPIPCFLCCCHFYLHCSTFFKEKLFDLSLKLLSFDTLAHIVFSRLHVFSFKRSVWQSKKSFPQIIMIRKNVHFEKTLVTLKSCSPRFPGVFQILLLFFVEFGLRWNLVDNFFTNWVSQRSRVWIFQQYSVPQGAAESHKYLLERAGWCDDPIISNSIKYQILSYTINYCLKLWQIY